MKTLFILTGLFLFIVAVFAAKDRRYAKKQLKDVATNETKAYLNLKDATARFDKALPHTPVGKRPSQLLLQEINNQSEDSSPQS